jgi:dihydroxy-acid dehydratase
MARQDKTRRTKEFASRPRRSSAWFAKLDRDGFIHRSWMKRGLPDEMFDGRPVIGILTSWSEATPCNLNLESVAEHVKRGVWQAGGLPLVIPVMSLGETLVRPTAMLYRNLMSMVVEETIRMNPLDGIVLLCGCDKTTAAMLLGGASVDLPTIVVTSGPMLTGRFRGRPVGSGTDVWAYSEQVRAGQMTVEDFVSAESCMTRSFGFCNTMGTASTLSCLVEALGLSLSGMGAIPAADTRRLRGSHLSGRRIVEMVKDDIKFSDIVTRASLENAIVATAAIGGSTNAVIHLLALAGRLEVPLSLDDFEKLGADVPLLVDLKPSGAYLMEDFFNAGGLSAVLSQIKHLLNGEARTVSGATLDEHALAAEWWDREIIRPFDSPVLNAAGIRVLRGNLAPDGAIIKPSAATPRLLKHRGRAVVFDSVEDLHARIDSLDIDADDVMVLRGAGPRGYPGMPEVGNMPLPKRLLEAGVTDMVRVSDARMSGTAYGTVVLHVAPESAVGGPLAAVQTGDVIELDAERGTLNVQIHDDEMRARLARAELGDAGGARGYTRLYVDHVMQANTGADFDFLVGRSGAPIPRESH